MGMLQTMQRQGYVLDLRQHWVEGTGLFECKVMGFTVSGRVRILDDRVILKSTLPVSATPFKSSIEKTIRQQARLVLSREPNAEVPVAD
jgi:hypothetical protein